MIPVASEISTYCVRACSRKSTQYLLFRFTYISNFDAGGMQPAPGMPYVAEITAQMAPPWNKGATKQDKLNVSTPTQSNLGTCHYRHELQAARAARLYCTATESSRANRDKYLLNLHGRSPPARPSSGSTALWLSLGHQETWQRRGFEAQPACPVWRIVWDASL